jgi:VWFA-related protein
MDNRRRIRALCSTTLFMLGILLLADWLSAPSQSLAQASTTVAPVPSLTVNARTVIVDVVVTDKNGNPITGLRKEDFAVSEDGRPQQITTFEEHPGTHPQPPLAPLPANVFTNIPRATPTASPIVLLLDSLNTPLSNQLMVRKQMIDYLQHLQPGVPMAIVTLGSQLRLIQGFTDDPSILRAVIQDLKSGAGPQASTLLDSRTETTAKTVATQINQSLRQFLTEQTASQDSARALTTLDALQQLARYLAGIPGRKSVIWFSGAFPSYIFPNRALGNPSTVEHGFADETRQADAALASAQVAIYPIAAEGLANDPLYGADTQLTGQSAYDIQRQSIASLNKDTNLRNGDHATMDQIAEDTGGEAFYNSNAFGKAIARVTEDGSHFYTLSYTPAQMSSPERFRKIKVSLKDHPHDHLAYRHGYFTAVSQPAKAAKPGLDPLRPYMQPGEPDSTEIPLALIVQPAAPGIGDTSRCSAGDNHNLNKPLSCYAVSFVIAARGLHFDTSPDGTRHDTIDVTLLACDADGKPVNWTVRRVKLDMDAARYTQVLSEGVHFSLTIGVPKEATSLSGGVYDPASGRAGTLTVGMSTIITANQTASGSPTK